MNTKLSPKVVLLNFADTLGDNYSNVINSITQYATQVQAFRASSVEILGKSYRISKAINTSLIDFNGTKLSDYLGATVPTFATKPNVWFIYNQTDGVITYFADTLSRVDNALFDIAQGRPEVSYTDDLKFSAEYMEVISNLDHKSYVAKFNAGELQWQNPNVQTAIQVEPNVTIPNVTIPTSSQVQPSEDTDLAKIVELLKQAGFKL